MKGMEFWSKETNPETGEKFEAWRKNLRVAHDGSLDEVALLNSEYGQELAELAQLRFIYEEDPMGEACLVFYRERGVRKEFFPGEQFYERWALFTPLEAERNPDAEKKYPLVFWHHGGGNPIETDEFSTRFTQMAGKEEFIVAMLQDTRWQNLNRKIDEISAMYPVDPERIYVTGYSQGGQAAHSALLRIPERLAAAAPCGAEIFQQWDHLDVRYTLEELQNLRRIFVPTMEITGVNEFLEFLPVNHYRPIKLQKAEEGAAHTTWHVPGHDLDADPTNPPGKRADKPVPPESFDEDMADRWKLERLNLRMYAQHCRMMDMERCLSYRMKPDDAFHHRLGFYGDREETQTIGGAEHYIADVFNEDGLLAFRYCGINNFPHWPSPRLAELTWEFMRRFRRDRQTGRIVEEP